MAVFSDTVRQQYCLKLESAFGTIPTFAGANYCAIENANADPSFAYDQNPNKSGTYSQPPPVQGDKTGDWTFEQALTPSGAAGTIPDFSPILECGLGTKTVSAGVSVTYARSVTATPTFSQFYIDQPATADMFIAKGCVPATITITIGSDGMPKLTASGPAQWVLPASVFSTSSTAEKGGLGSFPSAPSTPVYNGSPIPKRRGAITLNGVVYDTYQSGTITIATGKSLTNPAFGSNIARDVQNGRLTWTAEWTMLDEDSTNANLLAFKAAALAQTRVALIFQAGTVAGSIMTVNMPYSTIAMAKTDRSQPRKMIKFTAMTSEASFGSGDEGTIVFT